MPRDFKSSPKAAITNISEYTIEYHLQKLKNDIMKDILNAGPADIAIGLVKEHGVALAEVARRVGVSTSAASKIIKRGK